jgi:hypothetical protein
MFLAPTFDSHPRFLRLLTAAVLPLAPLLFPSRGKWRPFVRERRKNYRKRHRLASFRDRYPD